MTHTNRQNSSKKNNNNRELEKEPEDSTLRDVIENFNKYFKENHKPVLSNTRNFLIDSTFVSSLAQSGSWGLTQQAFVLSHSTHGESEGYL